MILVLHGLPWQVEAPTFLVYGQRIQTVAQASYQSCPGFCEENPEQDWWLARLLGGTGVSPVGMQARRPYYPYAAVLTGETPVLPLRCGSYGRDARTTLTLRFLRARRLYHPCWGPCGRDDNPVQDSAKKIPDRIDILPVTPPALAPAPRSARGRATQAVKPQSH